MAVHATGVPRTLDDPETTRAVLARFVRTFESGRPEPWSMDSLADDYVRGMIRGIVAFEIPIDRLEGKAKLSQNRSATDRAGARAGLAASGDGLARAVAALMTDHPSST